MLIGYARISTVDQNLDLQKDALLKSDCNEVFEDTISGSKSEREGLNKLLKYIRPGDTVVVWKLRSLYTGVVRIVHTSTFRRWFP